MVFDQFNSHSAFMNTDYINPKDKLTHRDITSHNSGISHINISKNGLFLYSLGLDNRLNQWDLTSGTRYYTNFAGIMNKSRNSRFTLSLDSKTVIIPNNLQLCLYSTESGEMKKQLSAHFDRIIATQQNEITGEIYSAGVDRNILIWNSQEINENWSEGVSFREEEEEKSEFDELFNLRNVSGAGEHDSRDATSNVVGTIEDRDYWSDDD
jgi:WD40 repeat protein